MTIPAIVYYDSNNELAKLTYEKMLANGEIEISDKPVMLIAIGGDGTFIRALNEYKHLPDKFNVGLIGTGTVNYLAMDNNPIESIINRLNYNIVGYDDAPDSAINEVSIRTFNDERMMKFDIIVDDETICYNVRGDGVIIATAVGSTAYAMSAGGPIIDIGSPVNVIVPNNEYSRKSRPIVLSNDKSITISSYDDFLLYADGSCAYECDANDEIIITKGDALTLIHANTLVREEKNM